MGFRDVMIKIRGGRGMTHGGMAASCSPETAPDALQTGPLHPGAGRGRRGDTREGVLIRGAPQFSYARDFGSLVRQRGLLRVKEG